MNRNSYEYFILKDECLVIEIIGGKFDLSDYIKLKQSQLEDPDYNPNFNLLLDIRDINDILSPESIKEYTKDIKPVQVFSKKIKAAVITNSPLQVTGAKLYKLFENKEIDCEIFSTIEHAFRWLGIKDIAIKDVVLIKRIFSREQSEKLF